MIKSSPICICDRCGHRWLPESMPPKRCAKCKSPNWNSGIAASSEYVDTAKRFKKQIKHGAKKMSKAINALSVQMETPTVQPPSVLPLYRDKVMSIPKPGKTK